MAQRWGRLRRHDVRRDARSARGAGQKPGVRDQESGVSSSQLAALTVAASPACAQPSRASIFSTSVLATAKDARMPRLASFLRMGVAMMLSTAIAATASAQDTSEAARQFVKE